MLGFFYFIGSSRELVFFLWGTIIELGHCCGLFASSGWHGLCYPPFCFSAAKGRSLWRRTGLALFLLCGLGSFLKLKDT